MTPLVLIATIPPLFRGIEDRPVLSGPTETEDIEGFRIHYTVEGGDAVDPEAYLPEVIRGLQEGQAIFEAEGWPRPVPDDGEGGSDAIDVYITDVDVNGYANPVDVGDDSSCYIRVDPQIPLFGGTVASVARHELHHCIQFRYRTDLPSWLYESAATYEQYAHAGDDPLLDLAAGTLWASRLGRPEQRLGDDRDPYATFVWSKFWAEYQGFEPERLVDLWEALREGSWPEAMDVAAREAFEEPLDEVFLQYAVYNRFACRDDDGQHYLDDPLPCIASEVGVPTMPFEDGLSVTHDERRFTAAYYDLEPAEEDETIGVRCEGAEGLRVALVGVDERGRRVRTATEDETGGLVLDLRRGHAARLVVAGTDAALDATCTRYEPQTCGCAGVRALPAVGWLSLLGLLALRRRPSARTCRPGATGAPS